MEAHSCGDDLMLLWQIQDPLCPVKRICSICLPTSKHKKFKDEPWPEALTIHFTSEKHFLGQKSVLRDDRSFSGIMDHFHVSQVIFSTTWYF